MRVLIFACVVVFCVGEKWQHVQEGIEFAQSGRDDAALISFKQALLVNPCKRCPAFHVKLCCTSKLCTANVDAWHALSIVQWNMADEIVRVHNCVCRLASSPPLC